MAIIRRSPSNANSKSPVPNAGVPRLGVEAQKPSVNEIARAGMPQVKKLSTGQVVPIAVWAGYTLQAKGKGYIYNPEGSGMYGKAVIKPSYTGPNPQIPRINSKIVNKSTYVPGKKFS